MRSNLRIGRSLWLRQLTAPTPAFPYFRGAHDADVAIVGGGVTGCACALALARTGARVMLLDAERIGRGSTAASTALLMQETDVDFRDLARRYGWAFARRTWRVSRRAVRELVGVLETLDPSVAVDRVSSIYFSRDPGGELELRRELEARRRAGFGGRWLSSSALKRVTGIDGVAAIATTGNAVVDPVRACHLLAKGAVDAGARLFEHSHVRRVSSSKGGVHLELEHGYLRARWVIVATGYATPEFKPLAARFRMMNTYVVCTSPLSKRTRQTMGLGDAMIWDTERPYHYARWTPDHRLMLGGRDRPRVPDGKRTRSLHEIAEELTADLGQLYPSLCGARPAYAWEGLFATTPDGLPYIGTHRRYPRHLFALGYGGNGMTFGFLAAQILSRQIEGRPWPDDSLFAFHRTRRHL